MIPQSFIHDLLTHINIIDAIDRHVTLKKAGANYIACCPFHGEKTPSFTVSPTKQFYHCFGCGAHGNAINFLMEYNGLSFIEAVENLASSIGMQIPEQQSSTPANLRSLHNARDKEAICTVQELFEAMRAATQFYREQLKRSEKPIAYLKKRGLTGKTAARFGIGYAPDDWQHLSTLFTDYNSKKTSQTLARAGLVIAGKDGKQYDRFRDRIMFPILNQKGQVIAFGGRVIDQGEPKYLNSPETELFVKGQEIYNLFSARKSIRDAECVIVVEGYMDVVSLSQHGIDYVVATLGTAITDIHIQKLLRHTDKIIFCFDGDSAGNKAAWRALKNSLAQLTDGKAINFLFLPENEDPDSFISQNGKEAFEQQIMQSLPLSEFLLRGLSRNLNLQTDEDRAKLIRDAKPLLQLVKAPALALMLLKRLSTLCSLDQRELETLLQIKQTAPAHAQKNLPRKQPTSLYHRLILLLLYNPKYCLGLNKALLTQCKDSNEELGMLKILVDFLDNNPDIVNSASTVSIIPHLQDHHYRSRLEKIESEILDWDNDMDLETEFTDTVKKLQEMQHKMRMTELHNKPLSLLTDEEKRELQRLAMY
ncbi:DNA primase [Nitrosomonas aestuarii]|uniref:DNA primase n=1 Tax=Nitrosomonas aestuarii TaxID=52441 RepID=UPI000D302C08|nr:DNA primase [Nitrosomonas aestuarii]PTN09129.1 DNA primase [Nitrosomonas aestuarii]